MDWLEAVRLALALAMLAGAAVSDLRTRRVPNRYWYPFALAALVLLLTDAALHGVAGLGWPLAIALGLAGLFYAAWRLGLFGGADAKGLMVLAFLMPHPVRAGLQLPFAFDALANGALLVLIVPVVLLAWNVAHGHLRFPALLLAVPLPIGAAEAQHVWPFQRVLADGTLAWQYWQRPGRDQSSAYAALREAGLTTVWATPKIPFMAFAAAGAVVSWLFGNLVLVALTTFVH